MSSPVGVSFSRAAPRYREHAHLQAAMAEWLAEWLPAERIGAAWEVGAGTGLFTERAVPWKGRYAATDLSLEMSKEGRRTCPGVEWSTGCAEEPPSGPWDWIFTSSTLQWLENPLAVFTKWKQALAPGGRVLAGFFVEGSLPELRSLIGSWAPLTWRTSEEWEDALKLAGLRVRRSEVRDYELRHPSALDLLRSLHRIGASPIRRYRYGEMEKLLRCYDAEFREAGQVRATWKFFRFEASHG